jgi:GNAT superfamily N-acetyltransferase
VSEVKELSGYEIDEDPARIDVDAAWTYLSLESYWARGRSREVVADLVRTATRVVGVYEPGGGMVGFARAVSDLHTFAYLADVYVLEAHRGPGLGAALVRKIIDESPFWHVRWVLGTRDAHELYRTHGFGAPTDRVMERRRRDPTTGRLQEMDAGS